MDRRTWKAACRNDRKRVMEWLRSEEVRCPGSDCSGRKIAHEASE